MKELKFWKCGLKKALECWTQSLIGNSGGSLEGKNSKRNVECGGQLKRFQRTRPLSRTS